MEIGRWREGGERRKGGTEEEREGENITHTCSTIYGGGRIYCNMCCTPSLLKVVKVLLELFRIHHFSCEQLAADTLNTPSHRQPRGLGKRGMGRRRKT